MLKIVIWPLGRGRLVVKYSKLYSTVIIKGEHYYGISEFGACALGLC